MPSPRTPPASERAASAASADAAPVGLVRCVGAVVIVGGYLLVDVPRWWGQTSQSPTWALAPLLPLAAILVWSAVDGVRLAPRPFGAWWFAALTTGVAVGLLVSLMLLSGGGAVGWVLVFIGFGTVTGVVVTALVGTAATVGLLVGTWMSAFSAPPTGHRAGRP